MNRSEAAEAIKATFKTTKAKALLDAEWRAQNQSSGIDSTGFCYIASEALYRAFPDNLVPAMLSDKVWAHGPHWWLEVKTTGERIDLTADQFSVPIPYDLGRRSGFLSQKISKAALALSKLAGLVETNKAPKQGLHVAFCDHAAAAYSMKWHYSKCLPIGKLVKVGAWEDGRFIGCVLFGRGASPHLGTKFGLKQTECVEMVRVAFSKHETPCTRIISIALRMLKKSNPGLRLVVSFADPEHGHEGGIYQAGNWIYLGESAVTRMWWHDGRWKHERVVAGIHDGIPGWQKLPMKKVAGKFRYGMPLDAEMRNQIEPMRQPFPILDAGEVTPETR